MIVNILLALALPARILWGVFLAARDHEVQIECLKRTGMWGKDHDSKTRISTAGFSENVRCYAHGGAVSKEWFEAVLRADSGKTRAFSDSLEASREEELQFPTAGFSENVEVEERRRH